MRHGSQPVPPTATERNLRLWPTELVDLTVEVELAAADYAGPGLDNATVPRAYALIGPEATADGMADWFRDLMLAPAIEGLPPTDPRTELPENVQLARALLQLEAAAAANGHAFAAALANRFTGPQLDVLLRGPDPAYDPDYQPSSLDVSCVRTAWLDGEQVVLAVGVDNADGSHVMVPAAQAAGLLERRQLRLRTRRAGQPPVPVRPLRRADGLRTLRAALPGGLDELLELPCC